MHYFFFHQTILEIATTCKSNQSILTYTGFFLDLIRNPFAPSNLPQIKNPKCNYAQLICPYFRDDVMLKFCVVPGEKEMRDLVKRKQLNGTYYSAKTKLMHDIGQILIYLDAFG